MAKKRERSRLSGTLIIDKPAGMTSHDVVGRVRRRLDTRRVGHAGTLDPMATGVLVVMVGEATKLAPFLTADDKRYRAAVQLGRSTDTLDAEGTTTAEAPLPEWWHDERAARIEQALASERLRREQDPPVFSAIKIGGRSAHHRVRAGEDVKLATRPVEVRELRLEGEPTDGGRFELWVDVAKGYYVRSLARDLGVALGVPAHLVALRREASGVFGIDDAIPLDSVSPALLAPLAATAARALAQAVLTDEGANRTRVGAALNDADFSQVPSEDGASAWLDLAGALVAVGHRDEQGRPKVTRVFNPPPDSSPDPASGSE